jgi:hypothetical protein
MTTKRETENSLEYLLSEVQMMRDTVSGHLPTTGDEFIETVAAMLEHVAAQLEKILNHLDEDYRVEFEQAWGWEP